jgi:hypothetical protein
VASIHSVNSGEIESIMGVKLKLVRVMGSRTPDGDEMRRATELSIRVLSLGKSFNRVRSIMDVNSRWITSGKKSCKEWR